MSLVRTVSDTKREFYSHHTRPINSIYRRVVEELLVEMHLLSVNANFRYDPIYALGVVTSFDRFMQGYRPERDLSSIFEALCRSVEGEPEQYRRDAEMVRSQASHLSLEQIIAWNNELGSHPEASGLYEILKAIAFNPNFKYSRLFALGLYSLLEGSNADWAKDEKQRDRVLKELGETLKLPADKVQKDVELYRSNLEKMAQVQAAIEDALNADRKKRQQQRLEKSETVEPSDAPRE